MSFYITLPNNSPNIFDNNTQSCFSTLLGSPLNLKGDYERVDKERGANVKGGTKISLKNKKKIV